MWFALCLLLPVLGSAGACGMDVYIVAGQSNGYRISSLRPGDLPLPDGKRIFYYGMGCTSEPESSTFQVLSSISPKSMGLSLAFGLLETSGEDIALIQYCRCGSGVWDQRNEERKGWFPGANPQAGEVFDGGLFGKFEKFVAHARAELEADYGETWDLKGLFWHQGENDSNGDHFRSYEKNLVNLFWRFRNLLGEGLPIVMGEIRELTEGDREINRILAQVARKDPGAALAPAAGLAFEPDRDGVPNVHFSFEGCQDLGRRMVVAYEEH